MYDPLRHPCVSYLVKELCEQRAVALTYRDPEAAEYFVELAYAFYEEALWGPRICDVCAVRAVNGDSSSVNGQQYSYVVRCHNCGRTKFKPHAEGHYFRELIFVLDKERLWVIKDGC